MATTQQKWQEIANRGLQDNFDPQTRAKFDEAVKRGLIQTQAAQPIHTAPPPSDLPGFEAQQGDQPGFDKPAPTFGEKAQAIGETALTIGTGATFGALGGIAGTLEQGAEEFRTGEFGTPAAAERISVAAKERATGNIILPESELGQEFVKATGKALEPLAAFPPVVTGVGGLAGPALKSAKIQTTKAIDDVVGLVKKRSDARRADIGDLSIGAAEVPAAQARRLQAEELPVPPKLTKGQASRDFDQTRFERETAKLSEVGAPLRDRFEEQNLQVQQNLDAFIDETGGTSFGRREVGQSVEKALRGRIAKDKARIRKLYKDAEKSGGMDQKVDADPIADYLNKNRAEREESGIMQKAQRQIEALEIGDGNFANGNLTLRNITLTEAEALRRFINRNIKSSDSNDIRIGSDLKRVIDAATEGQGNQKYKAARNARAKLSKDFENVSLMQQLTGVKKGTNERIVALENVVSKSVISPSSSRDSLHSLRKVLQNSGDDGKQAWKDIQSGTLQHMQDEMLKNVATNQRGDRVVSAAKLDKLIESLDSSGKLEVLYGKRGAEQLRTLNDVAKTILTAPPNAVNNSNTATVLAGLMDVAISGTSGVPIPLLTAGRLLSGALKDRKLKARVASALGTQ